MNIVYKLGNSIYLNITNACPCDCIFCIRNTHDGVGSADNLWLEHEPSLDEIKHAIDKYNFDVVNEVVFCGFGEPMERADDVIKTAEYLRANKINNNNKASLRLNTNGLALLLHPGFDIAQLEIFDVISVSLNADDAEEYLRLTQSRFGLESFDAVLGFAREAAKVSRVVFSLVEGTVDPARVERCGSIAAGMGIPLKIRTAE